MHTFRVWAPKPKKVELQTGGKNFAMKRTANGWWTLRVPSATGAAAYGFVLDGEGPFPDPRSPSQPNGVHKLSRLMDQDEFIWTDKNFKAPPLTSAIIYELHVGTFTPRGTFVSAIEKLDHLVHTGITHVELMPVNEFGGNRGWGYDGVDLFAPHHAYGKPDDLKKLVNACHARGLAVILDVVYNHLGPSGNYLGKFGPYFTKKFATFWGEGINFDGPESDEVRRFFCDNALMWLRDFHFDGLRLDAVHAIIDTSATHILEQLKVEVEQLATAINRELFLIAESDLNDPRLLWLRQRGGYQLDAQWSDDFHHALHGVLTGEKNGYYRDFGKISQLADALRQAFVYDGKFSAHRRRIHGRPAEDLSGHRFLAYLQNHDQTGNRAMGDRSSQLVNLGKLKIGAAIVLTSPFLPMLFQGEEWGAHTPFLYFTDYQEPELARAVREGRCREFAAFGWKPSETPDPQSPETFERSKLNWAEIKKAPHREILEWHKALIALRRNETSLSDGQMQNVRASFNESKQWLKIQRGKLATICNFSKQRQDIPLHKHFKGRILLTSEQRIKITKTSLSLPPDSVVILKAM